MKILAIDTTSKICSVAVGIVTNGEPTLYGAVTVKNKLTHSESLLPMIYQCLKSVDINIRDIELFALNAGPGSFTGVRIGVSTVKGLAFGSDIPCAAVSTLDSIAEPFKDFDGVVCAVMDARRNQFYNALFKKGKRITDDRAVDIDFILNEVSSDKVLLCGDGALLFYDLATEKKAAERLILSHAASREQNAMNVMLCGYRLAQSGQTVKSEVLLPTYLRQSQAEQAIQNKKHE